jgi:hypothetical protein
VNPRALPVTRTGSAWRVTLTSTGPRVSAATDSSLTSTEPPPSPPGLLDQAKLHGTFSAVRDIGAALLAVQTDPAADPATPHGGQPVAGRPAPTSPGLRRPAQRLRHYAALADEWRPSHWRRQQSPVPHTKEQA